MSLPAKLKRFADSKGYTVKELCTGRYEISKGYEMMDVKAVLENGQEEVKVSTSPKIVPLVLASAVLLATFMPLVLLVYFVYSFLSGMRVKSMKSDLKKIR